MKRVKYQIISICCEENWNFDYKPFSTAFYMAAHCRPVFTAPFKLRACVRVSARLSLYLGAGGGCVFVGDWSGNRSDSSLIGKQRPWKWLTSSDEKMSSGAWHEDGRRTSLPCKQAKNSQQFRNVVNLALFSPPFFPFPIPAPPPPNTRTYGLTHNARHFMLHIEILTKRKYTSTNIYGCNHRYASNIEVPVHKYSGLLG